MVVDTSALMAILLDEPDGPVFASRLERSPSAAISSATLFEASIVAMRRVAQTDTSALLHLVDEADITVRPFDGDQARIAISAYARFGRKSGHSARLNFGDCFSYALARALNQPLLYKGDDFARTDIRSAL